MRTMNFMPHQICTISVDNFVGKAIVMAPKG